MADSISRRILGDISTNTPDLLKIQKDALAKPRSSRKKSDNRSKRDRRISAMTAAQKRRSLWMDLNAHWELTDKLSSDLAIKHNKKVTWVRKQLFQSGRVCLKRRSISKYNAWIHCKSLKVNEGLMYLFLYHVPCTHMTINTDLPPGQKLRLAELRALANNTQEWKDIPEKEMEEMVACTAEFRAVKLKGSRSTTEGHLTDVHATFKRIEKEVHNSSVLFLLLIRSISRHLPSRIVVMSQLFACW